MDSTNTSTPPRGDVHGSRSASKRLKQPNPPNIPNQPFGKAGQPSKGREARLGGDTLWRITHHVRIHR